MESAESKGTAVTMRIVLAAAGVPPAQIGRDGGSRLAWLGLGPVLGTAPPGGHQDGSRDSLLGAC